MIGLKSVIVLAMLALISNGCASILGGRNNTLVFGEESSPLAHVYVDGEYIGDAPGRIKVSRGKIQHGSQLEIRADGYKSRSYLILRKQHALYSIADILVGAFPLAIDYATGNIYRPVPRSFVYKLEKQN